MNSNISIALVHPSSDVPSDMSDLWNDCARFFYGRTHAIQKGDLEGLGDTSFLRTLRSGTDLWLMGGYAEVCLMTYLRNVGEFFSSEPSITCSLVFNGIYTIEDDPTYRLAWVKHLLSMGMLKYKLPTRVINYDFQNSKVVNMNL